MTAFGTRALLAELEATVEENLHRHLAAAEDWMPYEYVPWSQGQNFADLGGEPWSAEQSRLSAAARAALELNLLTEDNLPSYHRELEHTFGHKGAWAAWVNRWTAEEARHASCIRDYLMVTRGVDPEALEHARMATMQTGFDSGDKPLLNVCAYVSFQELATRISHRNTGHYSGDPIAARLLTRIAMDENLHMVFYRNLVKAALEVAPSQTLRAITDEIVGFVMPGNVIPGFGRKAVQIANAGIYDLRIHHDDVIMPLVRYWQVFELGGLDADGERARRELEVALETLNARAARFVAHRAQAKTEHSPGTRLSQPTLLFWPFGSRSFPFYRRRDRICLLTCAPTATRTRDLLLRRHSRNAACRRRMWPDVPFRCSENGWTWPAFPRPDRQLAAVG